MSDAISAAIDTTRKSVASTVTDTVTSNIPTSAITSAEKIKSLPVSKNPELVKKQIDAEVLSKKAETEQLALTAKELVIETGKQKLKDLTSSVISFPPKLPMVDPKILQAVTLGKQVNELLKQRKKESKENLKKGKDTYSYPLKSNEVPAYEVETNIPLGP